MRFDRKEDDTGMQSGENAVISVLSSQVSDGEKEESELNTTGRYQFRPDGITEISYS